MFKMDKLEQAFREEDSTSTLTHDQWIQNRIGDWKAVIEHSLNHLCSAITNDTVFQNMLLSRSVLPQSTLSSCKAETGQYSQTSVILHALTMRPFDNFKKFCDVLIATRQEHVVAQFLAPEIRHQTSRAKEGNTTTETDAVPANSQLQQHQRVRVDFDWKEAIRLQINTLSQKINPDNGLLLSLHTKGVINILKYEVLQEMKGCSNRASEILIYIMQKRPDGDFIKLCDSLRETKQCHIVTEYLSADGLKRAEQSSGPNIGAPAVIALEPSELIHNWQDIIVENKVDIAANIDVSQELTNELVKYDVFNNSFREELKEEKDTNKQAHDFLDFMVKRTDYDFALLRRAMKNVDQEHVFNKYLDMSVSQFGQSADAICSTIPKQMQQLSVQEVANGDTSNSTVCPSGIQTVEETAVEFEERPTTIGSCVSLDEDERSIGVQSAAKPAQSGDAATTGPVPIKVSVQCCTQEFYNEKRVDAYPMSKDVRGRCLIFNMREVNGMSQRVGTEVDGKVLKDLFEQLHFTVDEFLDFTAQQVKETLQEVSQDQTLEDDQCLALFVLSHGTMRDVNGQKTECIFGRDGQCLTADDILQPFTDGQCRYLKNKPRIAFFQACRGEHYDQMDADSEPPATSAVTDLIPQDAPSYRDFLIGFPTQSYYRSFRNTIHGSWYINCLVRIFMRDAATMDLCAMLNKLNGEVSRWKANTGVAETHNTTQVAVFKSNFRKPYLFFFPGIKC